MALKIVADEKICFVEEAFSHFGELTRLPGRKISRNDLKNAEILLTRSVTKVNEELLKDTPVKLVATATTGTDHFDFAYFASRGIKSVNAHGGSSNSVAEYVMAAILELAARKNLRVDELTLGVVGIGSIGSIVAKMGEGLGMTVLKNDPPLAERTGGGEFLGLDEILQADFVTLHVPLTRSGPHKTYQLVDSELISKLGRQSTLINTSRGAVVDNLALKRALIDERISDAVLDVWEKEPNIDVELMAEVSLGTSHIAGYSLDGKANCTAIIYKNVCDFLGISPTWRPEDSLPNVETKVIRPYDDDCSEQELLLELVRRVYDIRQDDAALRCLGTLPAEQRPEAFDRLRDGYASRREFRHTEVVVPEKRKALIPKLRALGFRLSVE